MATRFLTYLHVGKFEHPRKRDPGIGPVFATRGTSSPPHLGHVVVLRYLFLTNAAWSTAAKNPAFILCSRTKSTLSTSASSSKTSLFWPTQDAQLCRNTLCGMGVLNSKLPRKTTAACIFDASMPSSSSRAFTWP